MLLETSVLCISLDFELYWGVRDKRSIDEYETNIRGVHEIIPDLLKVFQDYKIHATWAPVGFLYFNNLNELKNHLPVLKPEYDLEHLSPYLYINNNARIDKELHFAPQLLSMINQQTGQEIGTHTFSHFYCKESGQTLDQFRADIDAAMMVAKANSHIVSSLVFPRNQWNSEYLSMIREMNILCFRGNQSAWIYKAINDKKQTKLKRSLRLLDSYFNLSGANSFNLPAIDSNLPLNIPASSYLRPFSPALSHFEGMKINRIMKAMSYAAKHREVYHLWWHPHNFGVNKCENIDMLRRILDHHVSLRSRYNMLSMNMGELAHLAGNKKNG